MYNGIIPPTNFPPKLDDIPADPVTPPYLLNPPAVIPIDLGRQLFVDDFLIQSTNLTRTYHLAEMQDRPVLEPQRPWEMKKDSPGGYAMVFSDGIFWDPKDQVFKMWYLGGEGRPTCYAVSDDGLKWERPDLDVVSGAPGTPGTNIVYSGVHRDSGTVLLDHRETDPARRFKMWRVGRAGSLIPDGWGLGTHFSPDGIHWTREPLKTGSCGDRSIVFYNPFRERWVYSLRHGWSKPRKRRYWERISLDDNHHWQKSDTAHYWTGADSADWRRSDIQGPGNAVMANDAATAPTAAGTPGTAAHAASGAPAGPPAPELYNLDCVAYESLILGMFNIWRGDFPSGRPKHNDIVLGYTRDGWSWDRPDRRAFCPVSEDPSAWNHGNVQSGGGCCVIVGDKLHFYVSGRRRPPQVIAAGGKDEIGCTGLATLRRDGFASMDAAEREGTLTTRPLRFTVSHLFVNLDAPKGELRVEVLDEQGHPLPRLSRADCVPVTGDKTKVEVKWKTPDALTAAPGRNQPVRLRFHLRQAKLYAFWVSQTSSGQSTGYVAAGGPAYPNDRDA